MTLRFGLGLFTGQIPGGSDRTFAREYSEMLELVRLAESVGFDSAWVSEHHGASDGYLPSLLAMLAAFAAVTDRIRLGTGVVLAPLHHPLRLAEDAAVVDQLSDGRLDLGLGVGWREEEFRMFGVPMSQRGVRTEETVEILRRAWTGRRFSFEGRAFTYDRVRVTPRPARDGGPRIFLGGYAAPAVRRAGRLADGYITDDDAPEVVRAYVDLVDDGARSAGRDPSTVAIALMRNVAVGGEAWAVVREGVRHQLGAYEAWDAGADTPDLDELPRATESDEELRASTVAGPPAAVARTLGARLAAIGAGRELELIVRLHYPGMDLEPGALAVELFASEVIPKLRGEGRAPVSRRDG